jgi:hypothetical protein
VFSGNRSDRGPLLRVQPIFLQRLQKRLNTSPEIFLLAAKQPLGRSQMLSVAEKKLKYSFRFIWQFSAIGFLLHLAWELLQCSSYFRHLSVPSTYSAMILVSLGDVAIMWAVFFIKAVSAGSLTWYLIDWNTKTMVRIILISSTLSFVSEFWAIEGGRWAYTENNPVLPLIGVSILPIIQMSVITPISFLIAKKFLINWPKTRPVA